MSLAFEVGEEISIASQKNIALRTIYTMKHKHNNINNHSVKHTNKRKHANNNHNKRVLNKVFTRVQHVKRLSEKGAKG